MSEHRDGKHETGNCSCGETTSPFCQQWTCNTRFEYDCSTMYESKTCITKGTLNCDCIVPADNEQYCWTWHCRGDSNLKPGGYHENEDYECVSGDVTGEFCFRWHGNTSSKYQLESSACQCFARGERFCRYWQCRERGIGRCTHSGPGWCRLEISIGVGGGLGLLSFAFSVGFPLAVARGHQDLMTPPVVVVFFAAFCLPWSIGVLIWGGSFGYPWVMLMWSVGFIAIFFGAKQVNKERQRRRNERAARQTQNMQSFQPTAAPVRRPPTSGGAADGAHHNCLSTDCFKGIFAVQKQQERLL